MGLKRLGKNLVLKNGTIMDPYHKKTIHGDVWIKDGGVISTNTEIGHVKKPHTITTTDTVDSTNKWFAWIAGVWSR